MPTDDLDRLCCQNPDCDANGHRGGDNVLVIDHFGKARHRLLYCRTREARFSKLPHDKMLVVLEHLVDGYGVRQTARLVGINRDTVTRLSTLAGH